MENKTAIITGSNGNLGSAVVKKFLANDYNVIATVRHLKSKRQSLHPLLQQAELDLLDEMAAKVLVEKTIKKYGTIDVAVLTAGGFEINAISKTNLADLQGQYKLNFETAYTIARPVFSQMMEQQSGKIFLIGSHAGMHAGTAGNMIGYSLSKSLLFRLAEILNEEGKKKNVVTTIMVPSVIDTPKNRKSMPHSDFSAWQKPEEIADIIYYYCTPEASRIRKPVIQF